MRPALTHSTREDDLHGPAARERDARRYVTTIRPIVASVGLAAALLDLGYGPRVTANGELAAVGVLLASMVPITAALLLGWLAPRAAVLLSLTGDVVAVAVLVTIVLHPELAACTFALLVPLIGYFSNPRASVVFSIVVGAVLTVGGPQLDSWNDPTIIPWSAFVLFTTGITSAFVISRMRATEGALVERATQLGLVDRARDRLIANVSHELRTPLTATIGSVETLLRTDVQFDDVQRDELLRLARDGGLRLLSLVEDLLTLGSTRPDSLHLVLEPLSLDELVHDALVGIDPGHGRTIQLRLHDGPVVAADRMRMMQVMANLVVNGLRHGAGDVVVETRVAHGDEAACVVVRDDGPGVPPEHVGELFLPFARFSDRADSTGLGLAICRTIVEAHGGTITYRRTEDHATEFVVALPQHVR